MDNQRAAIANTRVLVVEDHPVVREGVCVLLQREPDIQVIGSVGTGEAALGFVQRARPDVIVMDLGLPDMNGIETTRKLKEDVPDVHVLALTAYTEDEYVVACLDAGASGYLSKRSALSDLIEAVRAVSRGECFLDAIAAKTVVKSLRKPRTSSSGPELSEREKEILALIGRGYSSKEIGSRLFLSPKTVDNYRARIPKKLGARNCFEAVSMGMNQGIIAPPADESREGQIEDSPSQASPRRSH